MNLEFELVLSEQGRGDHEFIRLDELLDLADQLGEEKLLGSLPVLLHLAINIPCHLEDEALAKLDPVNTGWVRFKADDLLLLLGFLASL